MRKKLVLIQCSRALVPIFVILIHIAGIMNDYFNYSFLGLSDLSKSGGVYYFFTLSGFMIHYIYRKTFGDKSQLKGYLLNRLLRIYPLYWIITLTILPIYFLVPDFGVGYETDINTIVLSLLLLPQQHEPILLVAWSLVHTVFFYLIFSLMFLIKAKAANWILVLWATMSLIFAFQFFPVESYLINFCFDKENLFFLLGVVCSHLITNHKLNSKMSVAMSVVGLIGFPLTWINELHRFVGINFEILIGISGALLIVGFASFDTQKTISIPTIIDKLGNAAFSIYLTHVLTLSVLVKAFSKIRVFELFGGAVTGLVLLFSAMFTGLLIHLWVEKPITTQLRNAMFKNKVSDTATSRVGDTHVRAT